MHPFTEISTQAVSVKDRLSLWGEAIWRNVGGLRSEAFGEDNFNGRIVTTSAGYLRLCRLEATSHRVVRTPELIRAADEGYLKVVAQLHGRACFQQAGREVWLSPGDWSVYDTTRAYTVTNPVSVEQLVIMIPKRCLPEALPDGSLESLVMHRLSGQQGVGRLAWDTMLSLYQELPKLSEKAADGMANVLTELVHLSLLDVQGRSSALSQREVLRDRIVGHVARHLRDPSLSVDAIARALNCSRRHLYNAFAQEPDGVAGYIVKQRAAHARMTLDDPRNASRSLTDVAYDCGFSRPSQLTQVFRAHFGMPPGEYRARQQLAASKCAPEGCGGP